MFVVNAFAMNWNVSDVGTSLNDVHCDLIFLFWCRKNSGRYTIGSTLTALNCGLSLSHATSGIMISSN